MSDEEISALCEVNHYKPQERAAITGYRNMLYKMAADKQEPAVIFSYLRKQGYPGTDEALEFSIRSCFNNNFGKKLEINFYRRKELPGDVIAIKRFSLFQYITAKDKEKLKSKNQAIYFDLLQETYPIVKFCNEAYQDFRVVMDSQDPALLCAFIEKYTGTILDSFVNGIKKDIVAVENTISFPDLSSGYVEGGNTLIKAENRKTYGRANTQLLFLKSYCTSIIHKLGITPEDLLRDWLYPEPSF